MAGDKITHESLSKLVARARYYGEHICDDDIIELCDAVEQLQAEVKSAYFCLGPDYAGEWELGDKRRPLDSLVSEVVGQWDNAKDEIERLTAVQLKDQEQGYFIWDKYHE